VAGTASERDVLGALKKGRVEPVYLLLGDDEQGKTPIVEALSALVDEDLRGFNLQRFYANECEMADIVAAARTLPFLGGRRVVIVLRGEAVLKPKARGGGRAGGAEGDEADAATGDAAVEADRESVDLSALAEYLPSPSPDACLVIVASDIHRGTRVGRLLLAHAVVVEFWGLKGERDPKGRAVAAALHEASHFVERRAREANLAIEADAIDRLVDHAGSDIAALRGALERLLTYCAGRTRITAEDVRAVAGGATSHDDWAMVDAMEHGDVRGALRQLTLMLEGGASPYQVLGQIGFYVRSRMAYGSLQAVSGAVSDVFETDLALKTSRGDPQVLLERLIVKLCGGKTGRPAGEPRPFRRR